MNSSLFDGPLQKQIVLLKLIHEMNNRPNFGGSFDNDPDGPVRSWISRVKALMERVSISKGVEFRSILHTAATYWQSAMRSLQVCVNDAIEELKLELELYQDDEIGTVYSATENHRFKTDVLDIINRATSEVFLIDPYFDAPTFALLFNNNTQFGIRTLCFQYFDAVQAYAQSLSASQSRTVEVRKSKLAHDRVIFVDDDCWIVGASIKDAGAKPTYLMPLTPSLGVEKKRIYEGIWAGA